MEELIIPIIRFPVMFNLYTPIETEEKENKIIDLKEKSIQSYPLYTKKDTCKRIRRNSW